jgi:uncharacterized protein (TIGR00299 family) protein
MKALLFDPFSGASGDMTMACLLDLGADPLVVSSAVSSVGCTLLISKAESGHIQATRAVVSAGRSFKKVEEAQSILEGSSLSKAALKRAERILSILALAESRVHGGTPESARFHEIGALDALADIAGCCAAMESLGLQHVFSLPPSVGGGVVQAAHGFLPVPAPATLEILREHDIPWKGGPVNEELLTPTGAGVLAEFCRFVRSYPEIRALRIGYGAGKKAFDHPNVLRGIIGEMPHHSGHDRVVQIETNVDDVTGETLGNLIELLMDCKALDVSVLPAVMKKGRLGNVISVIAGIDDMEEICSIIMRETGSLGIRVFPLLHRIVAQRDEVDVELSIGGSKHRIGVKVARINGRLINIKPEHDDCKRVSRDVGLPLKEVARRAAEAGWRIVEGSE